MTVLSEVMAPFRGDRLIEWFADLTELWHDTVPIKPADITSPQGLTQWVHFKNFVIWHLKEQMLKEAVNHDLVAEIGKTIDHHNSKRLEAIEQIDIWIENVLISAGIKPDKSVEVNSESPGNIINRLSILTLKIYHLNERLADDRFTDEELQVTALRKSILEEQLADLAAALDKLILDLRQAKKRHQVYRQFKIYNDPSFHPEQFIQK